MHALMSNTKSQVDPNTHTSPASFSTTSTSSGLAIFEMIVKRTYQSEHSALMHVTNQNGACVVLVSVGRHTSLRDGLETWDSFYCVMVLIGQGKGRHTQTHTPLLVKGLSEELKVLHAYPEHLLVINLQPIKCNE
jgi:hypothetical protein